MHPIYHAGQFHASQRFYGNIGNYVLFLVLSSPSQNKYICGRVMRSARHIGQVINPYLHNWRTDLYGGATPSQSTYPVSASIAINTVRTGMQLPTGTYSPTGSSRI